LDSYIRSAISALVLRALSGQAHVVECAYRHLKGEIGPSEAPELCGCSKNTLKGFEQRVKELVGAATGDLLILKIAPLVLETVKSVIKYRCPDGATPGAGCTYECLVCGLTKAYQDYFPQDHIVKRHRDLLAMYTAQVIKKAREKIAAEKRPRPTPPSQAQLETGPAARTR